MIIRRAILNSMHLYKKYRKSILHESNKRNKLIYNIKRSYGRNNQGVITVRHKMRGCKKLYRHVQFKKTKFDVPGKVTNIEYDPNRNSFLSLIQYKDKTIEYHIHINNLKVGDYVTNSLNKLELKIGNTMPIKHIPQGTVVSNICIRPNERAKLIRAAGTSATIVSHNSSNNTALVKLISSGFIIRIKNTCLVTVGQVSNIQYKNLMRYKAGQSFHRGIRPTVRGVAMNSVDHPHGGGEGRARPKRQPVSYNCKYAKGKKTLGIRSKNNKNIIKRRDKIR